MYWHVSAINPVSARLIGAIFLERGLVTEEQLQAALALQVETKEHLGEILVQHFGVSRIELASVLAEQWAELERANAGTTPPEVEKRSLQVVPDESAPTQDASGDAELSEDAEQRRPLGEIFVERGLVTDDELDHALQIQKEGGEKLGEILVAQGSITRLQLASALAEQWTALRKIRPPSSPEDLVAPAPTTGTAREVVASPDVDRLHEAVSALEQRLRAAESAAAREPWREEIAAASESMLGTLAELQTRLEATATRDELAPVEELRTRVHELANRLEENATSERLQDADLTRRVESAAEAAEAAKSSLGGAFESLSLRLADVESRVHDRTELTALQQEVGALADRIGDLGAQDRDSENAALRDEVKRLADEVNRLGGASGELGPELVARVDALTVRIDDIVPALRAVEDAASNDDPSAVERELTALATRLEALENAGSEIAEIRGSLAELHAQPAVDSVLAERLSHYGAAPDQLAELRERLEQVEHQSTEAADRNPALDERIESLSGRLQEFEASGTTDELLELRRAVEAIAARPTGDPALAERVERIADRLDAAPSSEQIEELRARIEALAARPAGDPGLSDRIERIADRLDVVPSAEQLHELASRLDELAARVGQPPEGVAELRAELASLASRPVADPALTARLDTLANRLDQAVSADEVADLRSRLDELASRPDTLPDGLDELRARIEQLASRPAFDPALADRVERIASRIDSLPSTERLDELSSRLAELASRASESAEGVAELETRIDDLASRPARDEALAEQVAELSRRLDEIAASTRKLPKLRAHVDELAEVRKLVEDLAARPGGDELADDLRRSIERLGARVDAVEELASEPRELDHEPRFKALESKLEEAAVREAGIGDALEHVSARISAVDELRSRLNELADRVGASESAHGKSVKKSDLASLRAELTDRLEALDQRVASFAASVDDVRQATTGELDDAIAALRKDVEGRAADVDGRVAETEREAVALREQLERLLEAAEAKDAERKTAEVDLERRIEELSARLAEALATPETGDATALDEVRSELASLAKRLKRSDKETAEALAKLTTDLEGVAQSSLDLIGHVERGGAGDSSELDSRIDGLERRIEADSARADEQVRATEEALREGLAALGGRLAETESSYIEAGDALRRSIERLGAAIVEADSFAPEHVPAAAPADEPQTGPFLAFVPSGGGYGLRELEGTVPAVGSSVSIADGDDDWSSRASDAPRFRSTAGAASISSGAASQRRPSTASLEGVTVQPSGGSDNRFVGNLAASAPGRARAPGSV